MTAILVTIPERDWIDWLDARDNRPDAPWSYSQGDKPPPVKAGDAVYVCALGRVRGFGIALSDVRLGGKVEPINWGRTRQPWSIEVGPFGVLPEGERIAVKSLQSWRHWPIREKAA